MGQPLASLGNSDPLKLNTISAISADSAVNHLLSIARARSGHFPSTRFRARANRSWNIGSARLHAFATIA